MLCREIASARDSLESRVRVFMTLIMRSLYVRTADEAIRGYEDSAVINRLTCDRHADRTKVERFLSMVTYASEVCRKNPFGVPMISTWSRVTAAVPDVCERLPNAVGEDQRWDSTT